MTAARDSATFWRDWARELREGANAMPKDSLGRESLLAEAKVAEEAATMMETRAACAVTREPRVLARLERDRFGSEAPAAQPQHALAGRLAEMVSEARRQAEQHRHPRDLLLILADWAEEAAVEFRGAELPEHAEAYRGAAESLRTQAATLPVVVAP